MAGNAETVIYFKNGKILTESTTKIYKMKALTDDKGTLVLMDMASGEKIFVRKPKVETGKEKAQNKIQGSKIQYTIEKKNLLGYACTKAFIFFKDPGGKDMKMTVWYTEKIKNSPGLGGIAPPDVLTKLKGMALEMDMEQSPVKAKMIVTKISTKQVSDAVFVLSTAGYRESKTKRQ